jgi:hypothetical protein
MTERDWGSPYLNEIRRRLRTGRITHAQAQEKLRKAGYVECSNGSMLAPGTTALKRTADGKIDAEYYRRMAEYYAQQSGLPYDMEMAISIEARLGKLYEDMTDDDWRSAVNQLPPEQRQRIENNMERKPDDR